MIYCFHFLSFLIRLTFFSIFIFASILALHIFAFKNELQFAIHHSVIEWAGLLYSSIKISKSTTAEFNLLNFLVENQLNK